MKQRIRIALEYLAVHASLADLVQGLAGAVRIPVVVDAHVRAFASEAHGQCLADARARACHQCDLAL